MLLNVECMNFAFYFEYKSGRLFSFFFLIISNFVIWKLYIYSTVFVLLIIKGITVLYGGLHPRPLISNGKWSHYQWSYHIVFLYIIYKILLTFIWPKFVLRTRFYNYTIVIQLSPFWQSNAYNIFFDSSFYGIFWESNIH